MPIPEPPLPRPGNPWRWRTLAAALLVTAAGLRIAYLAADCPLDLAPDEAHYWDWSRHLDWSYYSKGPLVAYLIRGSCWLAGSMSQAVTGNAMLAVRLPAVACGALLLLSLYVLTVQVYGREGLALGVVAAALTLPPVAAGSSLMTIDAPYTCCWGWALVLGHRAIFRESRWAWPILGVVVGLGILAKYTMVLWLPSAALFLATTPAYRPLLTRRGFWTAAVLALACCLPLVVWNAEHDWVSLRHVSGQAGLNGGARIRWLGPLAYLGAQAALLLGFWFLAWAAAMLQCRPGKEQAAGIRYLWWMSAPVFLVFLLFSLKTPEEPNWPVTAYLAGLVLTIGWLADLLRSPIPWLRRATAAGLASACSLGLGVTTAMHRADWLQPVLLAASGPPTAEYPFPLRRFDPTCRLRGWKHLGAEVDRVRAALEARGDEPVLAASNWTLPGEVAFYCAGHPVVYSLGLALGDRHSQYDLWRPNPVQDGERFRGRTFLFVGAMTPAVQRAFEHIETPHTVMYRERGQPLAAWAVTVCRGFHGFPHPAPGLAERSF